MAFYNRSSSEFRNVSLTDVDAIEGLIRYRWMIDPYFGLHDSEHGSEVYTQINEDLICLYVDLDALIDECKLTSKQKYIINQLMRGESIDDLAKHFNQRSISIQQILHT